MALRVRRFLACALLMLPASAGWSQGTDQLTAQRNMMIIAQWLSTGPEDARRYDSIEQAYFEGRHIKEGGHETDAVRNPRRALTMTRANSALTRYTVERDGVRTDWTFSIDAAADAIRLNRGNSDARCDLLIRREVGQFAGHSSPGCVTPQGLALTETALWEGSGSDPQSWTRFRLARTFYCFADVPGVGGGRNIPFKRFGPFKTDDQGGKVRFVTHETPPRTMEITLRNVAWAYNNAPGQFTRNSLTMYISTIDGAGVATEGAYTFGEPTAQRIGINLKHILANCAMVPIERAKPEF